MMWLVTCLVMRPEFMGEVPFVTENSFALLIAEPTPGCVLAAAVHVGFSPHRPNKMLSGSCFLSWQGLEYSGWERLPAANMPLAGAEGRAGSASARAGGTTTLEDDHPMIVQSFMWLWLSKPFWDPILVGR